MVSLEELKGFRGGGEDGYCGKPKALVENAEAAVQAIGENIPGVVERILQARIDHIMANKVPIS